MSTPNHIVQLTRLDDLCKDWSTIHDQSCNLFSSLVNILTQRQATSNILHSSQSKVSRIITNTTIVTTNILDQIFQPQTLTRVIYKQSQEIEEILSKIHKILEEFETIVKSMRKILLQNDKIIFGPLTNMKSNFKSINSKQSINKKNKNSKSKQSSKIIHNNNLSFEQNIDDVTNISISLSNLYITRIVDMYEKELSYKRNLILGGNLIIDHSEYENNETHNLDGITIKPGIDGVKLIVERWADQPYLEFEIEEEMMDRIKIWKKAKEFEKLNK
ncbi:11443_t:CDS:1 [Cetraspora pellucida]|uniref:11443_t:CDS:1 n=1 Tax=Cetraspora pellucida TaxID=1433469 RepID=A0ACA9MUN7_9GLOM|nr:11443_t:CDS:1 [Cetraspora pellucida]